MALTPINFNVESTQEAETTETVVAIAPSKTWKLDIDSGRIGGFINGEDAIRQYIRKAIVTYRNRYLIYDDTYGSELRDLLGQNLTSALRDVEIPRYIREAIIYDERIEDVPSITIDNRNGDVFIAVSVTTVDGLFITEEVVI